MIDNKTFTIICITSFSVFAALTMITFLGMCVYIDNKIDRLDLIVLDILKTLDRNKIQ